MAGKRAEDKENALIVLLERRGMTRKEIARHIPGATAGLITSRLERMRQRGDPVLTADDIPPDISERIIRLRDDGLVSYAKIAGLVGRTSIAVERHYREMRRKRGDAFTLDIGGR